MINKLPMFVLSIGTLFFASCTPTSRPADKTEFGVRFAETRHDHGLVDQTGRLRHRFEFWNESSTPIQIVEVLPNCGCELPYPVYTKEVVPSGGSGFVEFSASRKAPGQSYDSEVQVTFLRGSARAQVILAQRCTVRYGLSFDRDSVRVEIPADLSEALVEDLKLMYLDSEYPTLNILAVETSADYLEAQVLSDVPAEHVTTREGKNVISISLQIRILPTAPAGHIKGRIMVRTDAPDQVGGSIEIVGTKASPPDATDSRESL